MRKKLIFIILVISVLCLYGFKFGTVNLGKEAGAKAIDKFKETSGQGPGPYRSRDSRLLWLAEPVEGWGYWGSIAISGDTIYLGTSGIDGEPSRAEYPSPEYTNTVCAINKSNGKIKWKFQIDEDEVVKGAIVVSTDTIYFITVDMPSYGYSGPGKTYLYALNFDGTKKWKKVVSNTRPHFWGQTSPAVDTDGTIYIYVNVSTAGPFTNALIALNPDGTEKWRYEIQHLEGTIWPAPTVSSGVIYVQSTSNLYAISASTGGLLWQSPGGDMIITSPVIGDSSGTIYVGQGKYIVAYSSTGVEKWRFDAKADIFAQPVIGEDGTIYVVTSAKNKSDPNKIAGYFWAVDPSTGGVKWMFNIDQWMYDEYDKQWKSSDNYAPAVVGKDGTIYFTTEYRYMWALNPDGTMKDIYDLSKMPSSDDKWAGGTVTYSALTIDENGVIYKVDSTSADRDKNYVTIYAIQTESKGLANSIWPKGYKNYSNTNSY